MQKYVIYRRVSTEAQGQSGLGLEAQDRDISVYLELYAGEHEVLDEFTEVKSGAKDTRPQLQEALTLCRKQGATLLVSKLDRLSRSVAFIAGLLDDRKVELKVASMPHADKFQLHIYAALAEQERAFISTRTKAALKEAKSRGQKLGGYRAGAVAKAQEVKQEAQAFAEGIRKHLANLIEQGANYSVMARHLNAHGVQSANGGLWHPNTVKRVILRTS